MGLNGRIEPNYFLYRDASFLAEKKSCFFGSPGCVRLLRGAGDRFYDKKIDFYDKKPILGRKLGNLEREERSDEREVAPAACGIPE